MHNKPNARHIRHILCLFDNRFCLDNVLIYTVTYNNVSVYSIYILIHLILCITRESLVSGHIHRYSLLVLPKYHSNISVGCIVFVWVCVRYERLHKVVCAHCSNKKDYFDKRNIPEHRIHNISIQGYKGLSSLFQLTILISILSLPYYTCVVSKRNYWFRSFFEKK